MRRHQGPLRVQKHLYAEGPEVCQHIIVHPPGGIAGGDRLEISATVGENAWAQLTSPGAAKWYCANGPAFQQIQLKVAAGATLEWLPQETIIYSGARAELSTEIELQGDARLLRHMLRNLLENYRRHAAGAGVELEIKRDAQSVAIHVLDRGPGVPEGEREKIFEPFYRPPGTAETGEGVGYGLALVRRIARLHGGDVHCLARAEGGACFEVKLPVD